MLWGTSQEKDQHIETLARQWMDPAELKMVEGDNAGF
jgi:hypothetical protein